ncbi:LOW QUALITY PROTEIN: Ankyrin repeat-containing domain containing protein [Trema orientale]|uniref:Ankyrin repeat-containing domain containing protein n=1 Tax=Trema orientale TaxID=63057 RepID=A0A2P5ALT5_TREOI|nr:LOW QUALITY PROTEIN: Ankyrin repeat-containing domain containing protein [Trema orientale]
MYDKKGRGVAIKHPTNEKDISDESSEEDSSDEEFEDDKSTSSKMDDPTTPDNEESSETKKKESAVLIAAKYGIVEVVASILERFPVAIYDRDSDSRNILLLTVENRHLQVYKHLLKIHPRESFVYRKLDKNRNNALHYAAAYGEHIKPWPVPGAALQMQWEIKWRELYLNSTKLEKKHISK